MTATQCDVCRGRGNRYLCTQHKDIALGLTELVIERLDYWLARAAEENRAAVKEAQG